MFNFIKVKYFVFLLIISLFLYEWLNGGYSFLFYVNIFSFISFCSIIYYFSRQKNNRLFTQNTLIVVTLIYSSLFVFLYKYISFYYDGDYFVFSKIDAATYQSIGRRFSTLPLNSLWSYLRYNWSYDDYGAFITSTLLYAIWDSPFTFAIFYVLIGIRTAVSVLRIGRKFMPSKYAFLAALTFAISSFTITFQSTYLKETFMVFLIVLCYEKYYDYRSNKNIRNVLYMAICLASLVFFRPALIVFIVVSFVITAFFSSKFSYNRVVVLLIILVSFVLFNAFIQGQSDKYHFSGDVEETRQDMIRGGLALTYAVNILAAMFGPVPSIVSSKPFVTLFFPGLLFRIMTGAVFWMGILYVVRKKAVDLFPITGYVIFEIVSLVSIVEALELRKSLAHFPFIYLIMFWFMYYYDSGKLTHIGKSRINTLNYAYLMCVIVIMYIWNSRAM